MKKLMFAAALAACATGAFAADCGPEEEEDIAVARVYQVQMNVYTTKGVLQVLGGIGGTQCAPGETNCLVMRGRDKTVFRGYVFVCENLCELENYTAAFCDSRRKALFGTIDDGEFSTAATFTWNFCHVIGARNTDAECSWTFEGEASYGTSDDALVQSYNLTGAGYGSFNKSTEGFFDNFGGYFAGTASASYDLTSKYAATSADDDEACNCKPSSTLTCDTVTGLEFEEGTETVAFGMWKMKFNANVTKAYIERGEAIWPLLLQKAMK